MGLGAPEGAGSTGSAAEVFPIVLPASSSIFSMRTRISAPRLVRIGGGAGLALSSLPRFWRRQRRLVSRVPNAGNVLDFDAAMRGRHDVVPGLGRQRAAGQAVGRRVVVVAVPDPAHEVAGVADEPGVAVSVGGAGLARGRNAVDDGAACGAFADHVAHHHRHVGGDRSRNDLARCGPSRS